ncbi:hypothetical protein [Shimia ponticola]|uniref:hypothetical protein n=1 Tax=Shimia ponticola TaxID=2582893 RepID=UPI0011BD8255|nr:hypothetical protein [Shimia ponticola]
MSEDDLAVDLGASALFSVELILPMVILVGVAFWVPHRLAQELPQSMPGLGVNLLISSLTMVVLAAVVLAGLYVWQGTPLSLLLTGVGHLVSVAAQTALIWGPVVLLQLAMQPQHWRPDL